MKTCTKCGKEKALAEFYRQCVGEFKSECKQCTRQYASKSRRTKEGLLKQMHRTQLRSALKSGVKQPNYTASHLIAWALAQPEFHELYDNWVDSGYQKQLTPSLGRLTTREGYPSYSLINLEVMTFAEHAASLPRGSTSRAKAVTQLDRLGGFIKEFPSASQAQRETGVSQSSISACCTGKLKLAGNFIWRRM